MSLRETMQEEIAALNSELSEKNNAVTYASDLFNVCKDLVSDHVQKANSSASYDEKIDSLIQGLKACLSLQEKSLIDLINSVQTLNDKLKVLEGVLEKDSLKEETKKKDPEVIETEREQALP